MRHVRLGSALVLVNVVEETGNSCLLLFPPHLLRQLPQVSTVAIALTQVAGLAERLQVVQVVAAAEGTWHFVVHM